MIRSTTNGLLKSYRYNLMNSTNTLNHSINTVLTGKRFSSFADDPAAVSRSFQMRTSLLQLDSQHEVGQSTVRKYEIAWDALNRVGDDVKLAKDAILRAKNDPTASGLNALGQQLSQLADGIVQTMNTKFGENFVFAGADGLNPPFKMEGDKLTFRGIDVNSTDPKDIEALKYLTEKESKYVDIGLGLKEDGDKLNQSSAFNAALQGTTFLGYGVDKDGDPKNIVSIVKRMGNILQNEVNTNGSFKNEQVKEEFERLSKKFDEAYSKLSDKHTELDARTAFLKNNQKLLEGNSHSLQEQIVELENVDPADAITAYSWASYCYNAALKVGNNILSQSLMDYMNR